MWLPSAKERTMNKQISQMRAPLEACHKPAGVQNKSSSVLHIF